MKEYVGLEISRSAADATKLVDQSRNRYVPSIQRMDTVVHVMSTCKLQAALASWAARGPPGRAAQLGLDLLDHLVVRPANWVDYLQGLQDF